jgi:hypothetical protein
MLNGERMDVVEHNGQMFVAQSDSRGNFENVVFGSELPVSANFVGPTRSTQDMVLWNATTRHVGESSLAC